MMPGQAISGLLNQNAMTLFVLLNEIRSSS
jgi:hypothetical protein